MINTMGAGGVLTGGPALCRSGLLQLYEGPHHRRQGTRCVPPAGLPLADTLLLVSALGQRLVTLGRRCTPEEKISVHHLNLNTLRISNKNKTQNVPPVGWRGVHRASSTRLVCLEEWWSSATVCLISWRTGWLPAGDVWVGLTFTRGQQEVGMVEKTVDTRRRSLYWGL